MRNRSSALLRDGLLPVLVWTTPFIVSALIPGDLAAALLVSVLLSIGAAFLRAVSAQWEWKRQSLGPMPVGRQWLLTVALLGLLVSEAVFCLMVMISRHEPFPVGVWWMLGCSYAFYLISVRLALVPLTTPRLPELQGFEGDLAARS